MASTARKKTTPKAKAKAKTTTKAKTQTKAKAKTQAKTKAKAQAKTKAKAKTQPKAKAKTQPKAKAKAQTKGRAKTQPKAKVLPRQPASPRTGAAADSPFKNFVPYEPQKSETYMSDGQMEHFKDILASWRLELMEEVDRTVHHMRDEAANFPDPADRATQEEEFSIELRTRDRERKLIKKIDQTIDRIDQGDFGYCDTCGVEIGLRRLEARPTATQCVDCKSLDEIKERQLHG